MANSVFPMIDPAATGRNILRLRRERGLSVRDLQEWFDFGEPRAIYKWQSGQTLPTIDNLYALSVLLNVPMDNIIVGINTGNTAEPSTTVGGSVFCVWRITLLHIISPVSYTI